MDPRVIKTQESLTMQVADEVLRRSGIENGDSPLQILDMATGAGSLAWRLDALLQTRPDLLSRIERFTVADINEGPLNIFRAEIEKKGTSRPIEILNLNQEAVALSDEQFTHIFNNFGVPFSPGDTSTLSETLRLLQPRGLAIFTSWNHLGWYSQIAQPALAKYIPTAPRIPLPETIFPASGWSDAAVAETKMKTAGFVDVRTELYDFAPDLAKDVEGWLLSTMPLVRMIAMKAWSPEQVKEFGSQIGPAVERYLKESCAGGVWDGKMSALITFGSKAA